MRWRRVATLEWVGNNRRFQSSLRDEDRQQRDPGATTPRGLPARGPRLKRRAKFIPTLRVEDTQSEVSKVCRTLRQAVSPDMQAISAEFQLCLRTSDALLWDKQ